MHIAYRPDSTGDTQVAMLDPLKSSYFDKVWQFMRFCVVTGMIFSVSFFALNFGAYQQIFNNILNPEAQAKAQAVLGGLTGEKAPEVNAADLLQVLPDKKDVRKSFAWLDTTVVPTDNRIVIPKLGKSIPLVDMSTDHIEGENWSELEKQIQDGLREGVVHYPGTAKPGEFGNVFITGHSSYYPWDPGEFKDVFATLQNLEIGDRYYVYYHQKQYSYQIYEKVEVQPTAVDVLSQPVDKKISTLMTCSPVGTTLRRLIIKAEQI